MKNKLDRFDVGQSHYLNPNGGIPLSNNNTVEEGETRYNNFVYSDRIKVDSNLIKDFNLPNYIKNKSYSDASEAIDDKFKDRNDKASNETKTTLLDRLSKAHEYTKLQSAMKSNAGQVPDMMEGQVPEGFEQNQMFLGGEEELAGGDMGASAISGGLDALTQLSAGNKSGALDSFAKTGLTMGVDAMFPGAGQFAAPAFDIAKNLIGSAGAKNAADKAQTKSSIIAQGLNNNDFAYGGKLRKGGPIYGNETNPIINMQNVLGVEPDGKWGPKSKSALMGWQSEKGISANGQYGPETFKTAGLTPGGRQYLDPITDKEAIVGPVLPKLQGEIPTQTVDNPFIGKSKTEGSSKVGNWLDNNYGNVMRLAPVAMNAYQLSQLKGPEKEKLNRIDQRFVPEYADEKSIQNIVGNQFDNSVNALSNASNGSMGTLRNNILAAGVGKTNAMSSAYLNIDNQNKQMNLKGQEFNLGVNQFNTGQDNLERDINARNRAAYDNNKSKLLGQMGTDIGSIGKEEVYKNIAKNAYGYTFNGKYWIKPDGTKATDEQVKQEVEYKRLPVTQMSMGGYLKNKR